MFATDLRGAHSWWDSLTCEKPRSGSRQTWRHATLSLSLSLSCLLSYVEPLLSPTWTFIESLRLPTLANGVNCPATASRNQNGILQVHPDSFIPGGMEELLHQPIWDLAWGLRTPHPSLTQVLRWDGGTIVATAPRQESWRRRAMEEVRLSELLLFRTPPCCSCYCSTRCRLSCYACC
jgi:hypothetical protein